MIERNAAKRLEGEVQMDDAYIGGLHQGTFGRGAAAAVALTGARIVLPESCIPSPPIQSPPRIPSPIPSK
jgi:hypothetical protein